MRQRIEALTNYFMAHGIPDTTTAQHQAVIAIGKLVKREFFVLAFSDTFAVIRVALVIAAAVLPRDGSTPDGAVRTDLAPAAAVTDHHNRVTDLYLSRQSVSIFTAGIEHSPAKSDQAGKVAGENPGRDSVPVMRREAAHVLCHA